MKGVDAGPCDLIGRPEGEAAMAEATEFTIGARANCSDGLCGEVTRVVIDPAARTVTHLVIEPRHRRGAGRLVPVDLVDTTADGISLRCTMGEFGRLDHAEVVAQVEGLGDVGPLGGMGTPMGIPSRVQTVVQDAVPAGEAEVGRGDGVYALDGEIGRVRGFLVDPGDRKLTHVLLQEGHLWGRKEVAVPISVVRGVNEGIRLSITKKQVEDLPPVN
jgi:sporulation protein YlmC with PRC-barrel domain